MRRYTLSAAAVMAVAVPIFWWLMPDLVRLVLGERFAPATDAARVILLAAALQLVFGWTKSLPVSIGRPGLRVAARDRVRFLSSSSSGREVQPARRLR